MSWRAATRRRTGTSSGGLRHAGLFHNLVELQNDRSRAGNDNPDSLVSPGGRAAVAPGTDHRVQAGGGGRAADAAREVRRLRHHLSDVGRLQREGRLVAGNQLVTLEEVSEPRRGQRFAFIDTQLCDAAFALADGADMVVCESIFADAEAALARECGHLPLGRPTASRPSPGRSYLCSPISRKATTLATARCSPRGRRWHSAMRSCWPMTWTAFPFRPGACHQAAGPSSSASGSHARTTWSLVPLQTYP